MPAPTFLFALAPQAGDAIHNRRAPAMLAGARLLLRCALVGEKRTIRILQKSKRYNISFQGIKGNKNSAPQKSAEKMMCVNRCLHFVYL